ncbi:GumC family protein [Methylocaldum szegediense]|uniref:GNVR domain-containing protein n=1 Tax=Methylocaldum szegediense TaxID=73780 RepID=A0ABM9HZ60_9GAMM|nr:GNVR domain-containing protein [Methylocaldum szegediense]CAI8783982.1 GNVR domain-containing protein [Methylocaldum szegediense]
MEEKSLSDYLGTFRRHKTAVATIFGGLFALSLATALLLPPTYRSTATILIEEQEIPPDLVRSTITSYAAERLQMISQRVMTRSNLLAIVQKFDLYAKERQKETTDEIVERMREDIDFQPISAEVIDPRSGHPTKATIAFSLSYDGRNPDTVQHVANEITSLYLEENLKTRTQKTAEASDFLTEEVEQMGAYVTELEQKLAQFKQANMYALPEQKTLNLQFLHQTEQELQSLDLQLRTLQERVIYLDAELTKISPDTPIVSDTGQRILSKQDRLKHLQTELVALTSRYSEKHPDVVKAQREIAALQRELGVVDTSVDTAKTLKHLRAELAQLKDTHAADHPDVVALSAQIAAYEAVLNQPSAETTAREIAARQPDNPAYLSLSAQKAGTLQEIEALKKRRLELQTKLAEYQDRLQRTPDTERQYLALMRDYENASVRYRDLKAKQMEAQIGEQLERKSKGERLSVIEPPLLPEKPIKPNRPAIAVLGLLLGLAAAVGYIALRTALDQTVRTVQTVALLAGAPPLAVIPYLETDDETFDQSRQRLILVGISFGALLLALGLIHWFWTPLDVLWFRSLRKLNTVLG